MGGFIPKIKDGIFLYLVFKITATGFSKKPLPPNCCSESFNRGQGGIPLKHWTKPFPLSVFGLKLDLMISEIFSNGLILILTLIQLQVASPHHHQPLLLNPSSNPLTALLAFKTSAPITHFLPHHWSSQLFVPPLCPWKSSLWVSSSIPAVTGATHTIHQKDASTPSQTLPAEVSPSWQDLG